MRITGKFLCAALMAALSACSNVTGSGSGATGATGAGTGSVTGDPTSPIYFQQTVGDRVLFEVDQSTLTQAAQTTLNAQAVWLINNTGYSGTIEGHADEQGTREYNLALGARRASAARDYLVSRGVAANRLKVISYGKERPLEICSIESCYMQNRRAVTVLNSGLTG